MPPLHFAIADRELTSLLLDSGANPNIQDTIFGYTALHYLVVASQLIESQATEILILLIEAGADKSLRDFSGQTPLDHATDKGLHELVQLLR